MYTIGSDTFPAREAGSAINETKAKFEVSVRAATFLVCEGIQTKEHLVLWIKKQGAAIHEIPNIGQKTINELMMVAGLHQGKSPSAKLNAISRYVNHFNSGKKTAEAAMAAIARVLEP